MEHELEILHLLSTLKPLFKSQSQAAALLCTKILLFSIQV